MTGRIVWLETDPLSPRWLGSFQLPNHSGNLIPCFDHDKIWDVTFALPVPLRLFVPGIYLLPQINKIGLTCAGINSGGWGVATWKRSLGNAFNALCCNSLPPLLWYVRLLSKLELDAVFRAMCTLPVLRENCCHEPPKIGIGIMQKCTAVEQGCSECRNQSQDGLRQGLDFGS